MEVPPRKSSSKARADLWKAKSLSDTLQHGGRASLATTRKSAFHGVAKSRYDATTGHKTKESAQHGPAADHEQGREWTKKLAELDKREQVVARLRDLGKHLDGSDAREMSAPTSDDGSTEYGMDEDEEGNDNTSITTDRDVAASCSQSRPQPKPSLDRTRNLLVAGKIETYFHIPLLLSMLKAVVPKSIKPAQPVKQTSGQEEYNPDVVAREADLYDPDVYARPIKPYDPANPRGLKRAVSKETVDHDDPEWDPYSSDDQIAEE
ncbi:hypothetical protein LTR37_002681 [Vermiconidia calcicola]|uniref:Uncharacterized protein n=1 Tax=Vermiconidia calcicola TaxID=1690605 RepID=A0ACC3NSN1_9PEZI|nr:hypothetical protein LTR37_002681 [Vermiconidia calcicola]